MSTEIRPDLVDRMIELYCDWRAGCWNVRTAYERFLDAPAPDRAVAFAAYQAALDQEEAACEAYASQIERSKLGMPTPAPVRGGRTRTSASAAGDQSSPSKRPAELAAGNSSVKRAPASQSSQVTLP